MDDIPSNKHNMLNLYIYIIKISYSIEHRFFVISNHKNVDKEGKPYAQNL